MTEFVFREVLAYNPINGAFTWLTGRGGKARAGAPAGTKRIKGYVALIVKGARVLAHRAAWECVHGSIPAGAQIDHINGDRADNRIANLRIASASENQQNRHQAASHSRTGVLGVGLMPRGAHGFIARIRVAGKTKHLGCFATKSEAHAAYLAAKRALHPGNTL